MGHRNQPKTNQLRNWGRGTQRDERAETGKLLENDLALTTQHKWTSIPVMPTIKGNFKWTNKLARTNKRSPWHRVPASPMRTTCTPSPMSVMPLAQIKVSARSASLRSLGTQTQRCSHPLHHGLSLQPGTLAPGPWYALTTPLLFIPLSSLSCFPTQARCRRCWHLLNWM